MKLLSFVSVLFFSLGCTSTPAKKRNFQPFLTEERIRVIKNNIQGKKSPTIEVWNEVQKNCEDGLAKVISPTAHWSIPGYYDDQDLHEKLVEGIKNDSILSYEETLCFKITGDERFAQKAIEILKAWSTTLKTVDQTKTDSKLSLNEFSTGFITSAHLLDEYPPWKLEGRNYFRFFVRNILLPENTMFPKENNWANWGTMLTAVSAVYLADEELLQKAENRFRTLMDIQIDNEGILVKEIARSSNKNWFGGDKKGIKGIQYSNYSMLANSIIAEIMNNNGIDIYSEKSFIGKKIKMAFDKMSEWSYEPSSFPYWKSNSGKIHGLRNVSYFEVFNPHWKNTKAEYLLKKYRPLSAEAGLPHLTLTHGE